jgi:hypothetical protein
VTQPAAGVRCAADIHGSLALFDIGDLAVLVYQERSAVGYTYVTYQHTVSLRGLTSAEVAEERVRKGSLLGKFTQGGDIIGADS